MTAMAAAPFPTCDEIDLVMQVMVRAFEPRYGEAWNRRQVADALMLSNCHCGLIGADGGILRAGEQEPAGFYLSRTALDEEELLLFAIDPAFRRRGLGARLLRAFIAAAGHRGARRLFLEMRRNNPAVRLYAAHGFHPIGLRPGYYRTAEGPLDAVSFELVLP